MVNEPRHPVVLHSSWRGRMTAVFGPFVMFGLGCYGIANGGLQILNGILFVGGFLLIVIVTFDFPLHSVLGPDGIDRRCLVRTQRLEWNRVRAVARPGARNMIGRKTASSSGLIAEIKGRPHMLVDRIESRAEHGAIEKGLQEWAPGIVFQASEPPEATPPTWLHKKRKGPEDGSLVDHLV